MTPKPEEVVVIKMNPQRVETWRYPGIIINQSPHSCLIEAFFNLDQISFHGLTLRRNDRSIERFYDDRWYNIFEIHDREDDNLKAWYCNVAGPAEFTPNQVAYIDLALDLLVFPDGNYLILDQDEFDELALGPNVRRNAIQALEELVEMAQKGTIPQRILNGK